jgi:hypothetical protein
MAARNGRGIKDMTDTLKVLSIDAWGNQDDGFDWNNWFHVGDISKEDFEAVCRFGSDEEIVRWFVDQGYVIPKAIGKATIQDDQYNIVLCDEDDRPLYAIEYGPAYA